MFPKSLRFKYARIRAYGRHKKVSDDFVDGKWFVCVDEALRMQLVFSGGVLFGNETLIIIDYLHRVSSTFLVQV